MYKRQGREEETYLTEEELQIIHLLLGSFSKEIAVREYKEREVRASNTLGSICLLYTSVPNKVSKGQTVEIRCELKKTGDFANTLYTCLLYTSRCV